MHTLFWTVLILLHSQNLTMFDINSASLINDTFELSSRNICIHAATILLYLLDVLLNYAPNFYELSSTALFSFTAAIKVLSWVAEKTDAKAEILVQRLREIEAEVKGISRRFDRCHLEEDGIDRDDILSCLYKVKEKGENFQFSGREYKFESNQYSKGISGIIEKNNRISNKQPSEDKSNFDFTFSVNNNRNSQITLTSKDPNFIPQIYQQQQAITNDNGISNILSTNLSLPNTTGPTSTINMNNSNINYYPVFDQNLI